MMIVVVVITFFLVLVSFSYTSHSCMIVDTDMSFDDLRAISYLIVDHPIEAIVFTEGISRPYFGGGALSYFFKKIGYKRPEFLTFKEGWIQKNISHFWNRIRYRDEKLNHFLDKPLYFKDWYKNKLEQLILKCKKIQLVILGPLSSVPYYWDSISKKVTRIVMMGRGLDYHEKWQSIDFNCWYDIKSCREFFNQRSIIYRLQMFFLNDSYCFKKDSFYSWNKESIKVLDQAFNALSYYLYKIFLSDLDDWYRRGDVFMWDESAVMFVDSPHLFYETKNKVYEWSVDPKFARMVWLNKISRFSGQLTCRDNTKL